MLEAYRVISLAFNAPDGFRSSTIFPYKNCSL